MWMYESVCEKVKELREKKKSIEEKVKNQMGKAWEKFEDLKGEVAAQKSLLDDIAITTLMDGKTVEVVDEFSNRYEPVWSVRFKKTNEVKK